MEGRAADWGVGYAAALGPLRGPSPWRFARRYSLL